jgi:diguanylate cyclase (GGDEF)-like protein/PAS domain S-box-containing protein
MTTDPLAPANLTKPAHRSWAEAVIDASQDIVMLLEPDGSVRTVNPAIRRLLGHHPGDLASMPLVDLVHPGDAEALLQWLAQVTLDGRPPPLDIRCRHADGGWVDAEATATGMLDIADVEGIVVTIRDMRERRSIEAELNHWAFHDPLTNLANRARLRERIIATLDRGSRTGGPRCAVLLIDIDDFKTVNDSLGHQEGDRLLIAIAERLRHCARPQDTVARLGGDEFVVLLDEVDDGQIAELVAERIMASLRDPVTLRSTEVQVHACIGIRVADVTDDVDQLIRDADLAMYAAKTSGKASYRRFHPDMYQHAQDQMTLRAELRRALTGNEFVLNYQPIVSVKTQQVKGFEALIRWQHPERGTIPPDQFISHAEQTGLIVPIGAWVVRQACTVATTMRRTAGRELSMSVNVAPRQLHSDDIIEVVRTALRDAHLPADALCLEITESVLADDPALIDRLHSLRDIGVHLAIDDFGTGFSSYSHLKHLPIDTIKIDRSFIQDLGAHETTPAIARSIIRMSQSLGLRTIAEGIETTEQRAELQALGCTLAQGFLFSRPLDQTSALALLTRTSPEQTSRNSR